ncbi:MAG: hypothetical protein RL329_2668 [Bacteroidota bacterium]|jgi:hypothetical protein
MRNPHILRIAAGMLAITTLLTTSCKDETTVAVPVYAKAQFVHVAPEAPGVIASVDGKNINTDSLKYLQYINYVDVDVTAAGKRTIKLDSKTGNVTTDSLAMNKDVYYSFYAYSDTGAAKKTRVQVAPDDLAVPAAGKAKLRIAHFVSDATAKIDVEAALPGQIATTRNDFSALQFKNISNFVELAAGSYDLKVKLAGTTQLVFTIPSTTFEAGKSYTLVARGYMQKANASGVFVINNK